MMATVAPQTSFSLLPLLESLEDTGAGQSEQTDAYLTIANRLSGEEGRQFLPAVVKHFSRLSTIILTHISSPNAELSQAALQSLGFCVYHAHVVSGIQASFAEEILTELCSLVMTSRDKNTCTRALWVISKQSFPPEVVTKKVPSILGTLDSVRTREDIQSVIMEHEALNVVIRLLEQAPAQMGDGVVQWARLVIPLVVHSAAKVRLRAAAAMELGLPLLLEKQADVAAIIEPMMSSKLIPELQKLFKSKNEANVLKLWPLFVKLLGKLLHKGGPFINALLQLEELGFRSSSPNIKKIAFIAWKSLIDNFALIPEILCSAKRLKLLLQPLCIHVRTEVLLLTKVEVWWHLVVRLGSNLAPNFEQVAVPLLLCTVGSDPAIPGTPARGSSIVSPATPKTGNTSFNSTNLSLNSSVQVVQPYPSTQLLGLEMLLHYLLGPEVVGMASRNKLVLSLEPLTQPFLSGPAVFTKHAPVLISSVRDGFITVGKDVPEALLALIWKNLVSFVSSTLEHGNKKDRQGCEVLTLMLQALQTIVSSEDLPADRVLVLLEITVKGIPQRVLGSASYQVGKMDVLNGTPALFLILLFYNSSLVSACGQNERFFLCLETLVGCGLSGPTSSLAFGEAVLGAMGRCAGSLGNKDELWRLWSIVVNPLTDTVTQTNEVNQGDALEHNFNAVYAALMFPITHLLPGTAMSQMTQKSMLSTWSKLYKVFACCSALVVTAEENICCEELCAKMAASLDRQALAIPSTLDAVVSILQIMVECVDFSPYTPQFQQKMKSPRTPVNWKRKKSKALGNLSTYQSLLLQCLEAFLSPEDPQVSSESTGLSLVSILSAVFTNLALATAIQEALVALTQPLTQLYKQAATEPPRFSLQFVSKLEKLLAEVLGCLQNRCTLTYDDELLAQLSPLLCVLFPHKNKQLRVPLCQFWNATFANSANLAYPDELRPILSQAKQKIPIILPGFEAVSVSDELSGPDPSESSQFETKLSGVQVSSVGKRDSLLARAGELKERNSRTPSKPVSTKLDFGSPKPPRREVLEEEASIDFVFIPPETKERVLTEHQKEVKRTKRVDIPAMYNNLDASLDTTVFTQYTQSQDESMDKLTSDEPTDNVAKEAPVEVQEEDVEMEEETEILMKETQDFVSPKATEKEAEERGEQGTAEEIIPESADVSMEDNHRDNSTEDLEPKDGVSPNVSSSSDLVFGTPQKPSSSRRQSFITLEKYVEGQLASPVSVTKFTGPLNKTSNSQQASTPASQASQAESGTDSLVSPGKSSETGDANLQRPKAAESSPEENVEPKPVPEKRSTDGTEDEDDIIHDTQTVVEDKKKTNKSPVVEDTESHSQGEESESTLDDSQGSPSEPRRSGRRRARPLRPGDEPEEKEAQGKKTQPGDKIKDASLNDSQTPGRTTRRSKQAAEVVEDDGNKLRTRGQRDKAESSQTNSQTNSKVDGRRKTKLYNANNSEDLLVKHEHKRKGARENELGQTDSQMDTPSDNDSQSQGRLSRQSKTVAATEAEVGPKRRSMAQKDEDVSSQVDSQGATHSQTQSQSQGMARRSTVLSDSEEFGIVEQKKKPNLKDSQINTPSAQPDSQSQGRTSRRSMQKRTDGELSQDDSQTLTPSAQPDVQSQGRSSRRSMQKRTDDKLSQDDSQTLTPSAQPDGQSQGRTSRRSMQKKTDELSQDNSQTLTPSATDSQPRGRSSRQNKMSTETVESGHKSESVESENSQTDSKSQPKSRGRPRKNKVEEEQSMSTNSPSLTNVGRDERYSKRKSSQGLLSNMETSGSDSETREDVSAVKRRGRTTKSEPLPSPLTLGSGGSNVVPKDIAMDSSESSQKEDPQSTPTSSALETKSLQDIEHSLKSQELLVSSMHTNIQKCTNNVMEQSEAEKEIEMEVGVVEVVEPIILEKAETENTMPSILEKPGQELMSKHVDTSPRKRGRGQRHTKPKLASADDASSQESDTGELQVPETLESDGTSAGQLKAKLPFDLPAPPIELNSTPDNSVPVEPVPLPSPVQSGSSADTPTSSGNTTEKLSLLVSQSSEENVPVQSGSSAGTPTSSGDTTEKLSLLVSQSSEENVPVEFVTLEQPVEPAVTLEQQVEPAVTLEQQVESVVTLEQQVESVVTLEQQVEPDGEPSNVLVEDETDEDAISVCTGQDQPDCPSALNEPPEEQFTSIKEDVPDCQDTRTTVEEMAGQGDGQDIAQNNEAPGRQCEEEEETQIDNNDLDLVGSVTSLPDVSDAPETTSKDSPPKLKGQDAVTGPEVDQSPCGRTRGTWTPSASPSTSILKKGQKRPLEEETPSPLVKSRRVSFANPIHHQELADDIDRRSPVIRTNSPRFKATSGIPQPCITTPTKGLLILSPRNLHSPRYKSSKKCLISEMGHEPRAIPKDCVYPALVGCSTPVEAVLPQITSNMWPRGFGQLVRARNIKTVGDLSALTPSEVKNLPIRSPKISNVKRALKTYHEQQRKGRGADELKSFDEMEKMTSELEEPSTTENQEEDDKTSAEPLAMELVYEPVPVDQEDGSGTPDGQPKEHVSAGHLAPACLLSAAEALRSRMASEELDHCSPEQLGHLHDHLVGMTTSVVAELQKRLCRQGDAP